MVCVVVFRRRNGSMDNVDPKRVTVQLFVEGECIPVGCMSYASWCGNGDHTMIAKFALERNR